MTRCFTDEKGNIWSLSLTWGLAERIAQRVARPDSTAEKPKTFDLLNITDKDQAEFFVVHDPTTGRFDLKKGAALVNLLYVICEEQCKERNMSAEEFGKMMMTAVFGRAYAAFIEELENFILDPEDRTLFQNLRFLAGGNRSAVLSEANRTLTEKKTALLARATQIVNEKLTEAWKPVEDAMSQADAEVGMNPLSDALPL